MKKTLLSILLSLLLCALPVLAEEEPVVEPEPEEAVSSTLEEEPQPEAEEYVYEEEPADTGETEYPEYVAENPEYVEPAETYEEPEAWFIMDGEPVGGRLQDLIPLLRGDETIYICTEKLVRVKDVPLYVLAGVKFRPDMDVFAVPCEVRVYDQKPHDSDDYYEILAKQARLDDAGEYDYGDLYLRVEATEESYSKAGEDPEGEAQDKDGGDGDGDKIQITVDPAELPEGWLNRRPEFKLSGITQDSGWNYAVLIFDQKFIPLSGNVYVPDTEGTYTLKFVIQDSMGDIKSVAPAIAAKLDWTVPTVTVTRVTDEDYAIDITATDETSGVARLSVDGGMTWKTFENGETFRYTANTKRTLIPGAIRVEDMAGNVFKSTETYVLDKAEEEKSGDDDEKDDDDEKSDDDESGDDEKGDDDSSEDDDKDKSSSSSSTKKLPHASGNGADASPYTLKLTLPDEPMRQLIVGGKAMDLTLMIETEGVRSPVSFTGEFTRWLSSDGDATRNLAPDTLILYSLMDLGLSEAFNAEWHMNGEVYRELGDAGIKYIVFNVGDDYLALATEGITGGTKYAEFKMLGLSTRKFDYTFTMKVDQNESHFSALTDNDFSEDCDLTVSVEVEHMTYELSNSPKSLMYYYNVYLGPEEMLQFPFGKYEG